MDPVLVSRDIAAPLERVFAHFVSPSQRERLDLHADHVKSYRELDRGPSHLEYEFTFQAFGMRFWGRAREDFEPPSRTLIHVTGGVLAGAWIEIQFEPLDDGARTRVSQLTHLPPATDAPLRHVLGRSVLGRLRALTAVHLDEHARDLEGLEPIRHATPGEARRGGAVALLAALRAASLPLIVLPLLAGTALASAEVPISLARLALTLLGGALALFAGNLANDIWDFQFGADHAARGDEAATLTASGALIDGVLGLRGAWALTLALAAGAVTCGLALTPGRPLVPAIAAAGLLAALLYQAPPLRLAYRGRGLGELCIWAAFGPIPVEGAHYVQTGHLCGPAFALGAVVGVGAALVLYCHHFLHWAADRSVGKMSPVATLGPARAGRVGLALLALFAGALAATPWLTGAPAAAATAGLAPLLVAGPLLRLGRGLSVRGHALLRRAGVAYTIGTSAIVAFLWR